MSARKFLAVVPCLNEEAALPGLAEVVCRMIGKLQNLNWLVVGAIGFEPMTSTV